MEFDIETVDRLLSTTRAVRRRLDLSRDVPLSVVVECLRLAIQAPTAGDQQNWRWVVVTDSAKRDAIGELYRAATEEFVLRQLETFPSESERRRFESVLQLARSLGQVPVHVIGYVIEADLADLDDRRVAPVLLYGSIFPAMWSFQLALRSRGLGSTLLFIADDAALGEIVDAPADAHFASLMPVAYTLGTSFKPAARAGVGEVAFENRWGNRLKT